MDKCIGRWPLEAPLVDSMGLFGGKSYICGPNCGSVTDRSRIMTVSMEPATTAINDALLVPPLSIGSPEASIDSSDNLQTIRARGLLGFTDTTDASVFYRPTAWRVLLGNHGGGGEAKQVQAQRSQYKHLKRELWGLRESSEDDASDLALVKEIEKASFGAQTWLPTSCDDILFSMQDVCRTRSELAFFVVGGVAHQWMLRVLFVHAKMHPDIGYIQGMNEILAPLLFVYGNDSREEWAREAEADAFASFTSIMASMKPLYAPSPSNPTKSGAEIQMSRLMALLRQHDAVLWQHLVTSLLLSSALIDADLCGPIVNRRTPSASPQSCSASDGTRRS